MREIKRDVEYHEEMSLDEKLWCPKCGKIEDIKASVSITSNIPFDKESFQTGFVYMYLNSKCDNCEDSFMALLDKEIFNAVIKLNDKDYKTDYSCGGHSFDEPAYISFLEPYGSKLAATGSPSEWYFDRSERYYKSELLPVYILRPFYHLVDKKYYKIKGIEFDKVNSESIKNLCDWVDSLPPFYHPLIK